MSAPDLLSCLHDDFTLNASEIPSISSTTESRPDNLVSRHTRSINIPRQIYTEDVVTDDVETLPIAHGDSLNLFSDILQLQTEQDDILEQILLLEKAHEELNQARNELMALLLELDPQERSPPDSQRLTFGADQYLLSASGVITPINIPDIREEEYYGGEFDNEEGEDDDFLDEDFTGEDNIAESIERRFISGLRISDRSPSRLGFRNHNPPLSEYEDDNPIIFLDCNGNSCIGLEDTMTRAVGWVVAKDMIGIENTEMDKNGNLKLFDFSTRKSKAESRLHLFEDFIDR